MPRNYDHIETRNEDGELANRYTSEPTFKKAHVDDFTAESADVDGPLSAGKLPNVADHIVTTRAEWDTALSKLSPGDVVRVAGTVELTTWPEINTDNITIEGHGDDATLTAANGADIGLLRVGTQATVDGFRVRNLTLDGNAPNQGATTVQYPDLIRCEQTDNISIQNVDLVNAWSGNKPAGAQVGIALRVDENCTHVEVDGFYVENTPYMAMEFAATDLRVTNGKFGPNIGERGISLAHRAGATTEAAQRVVIDSIQANFTNDQGTLIAGYGSGRSDFAGTPFRDVTISNVEAVGGPFRLISLRTLDGDAGDGNIVISNCKGKDMPNHGVQLLGDTRSPIDIKLSDITVINSGGDGFHIELVEDVELNNCKSVNAAEAGYWIDSRGVGAEFNSCKSIDDTRQGFALQGAENVDVNDAKVVRSGRIGIETLETTQLCDNISISGGKIYEPSQSSPGTYVGFRIEGNNSNISGLRIAGGGDMSDGIKEAAGDYNSFHDCHISGYTGSAVGTLNANSAKYDIFTS